MSIRHTTISLFFIFCSFQAFAIVQGKYVLERTAPEFKRLALVPNIEKIDVKLVSSYARCSAVAISDSTLITAGHCVRSESGTFSPHVVEFIDGQLTVTSPLNVITEYIPENPPTEINNGTVPGCSVGKKPIFETKSIGLALLKFPPNTFKHFMQIDFNTKLEVNDQITYYGFGTKYNSFEIQMPISYIDALDLGVAHRQIDRLGVTRSATVSSPLEPFADIGDSGGAVVKNNSLVGILNNLQEKCETELGEDYGLMNSFTLLNSKIVREWFVKNGK